MPRLGWVVDCQNDFMRPDGRLYVRDLSDDSDPGAEVICDRLVDAVAWMRESCAVVVFTGDWHGYDDEEIDPENPDPVAGTYPPHCMGRSDDPVEREGAEIIEEIRPSDPLVLEIGATDDDARRIAGIAVESGREIFVRKNRFDVFQGNAATAALVEALTELIAKGTEEVEFVVVGVARDVCVTQAVDGLQARGSKTLAICDVTWGLGLEPEAATLLRWSGGGRVTTLAKLVGS